MQKFLLIINKTFDYKHLIINKTLKVKKKAFIKSVTIILYENYGLLFYSLKSSNKNYLYMQSIFS